MLVLTVFIKLLMQTQQSYFQMGVLFSLFLRLGIYAVDDTSLMSQLLSFIQDKFANSSNMARNFSSPSMERI